MDFHTKVLGTLGLVVCLGAGVAHGGTLLVANNGVDSFTCGTLDNPCRSISQAIHNAGVGDSILVGPGHYGDINGNGVFTDPGDEAAEVGTGCLCMIKVDKPLKIYSQGGADVTVLDGGGDAAVAVVVLIESPGVVFGAKGKGFTITGAGGTSGGLTLAGPGLEVGSTASHVVVAGNRAVANEIYGFFIDGDNSLLLGNVAIVNGFSASSGTDIGGFVSRGSNVTLSGNVALDNAQGGFDVSGANLLLKSNVAIGNRSVGVQESMAPHASGTITGNSFIGNRDAGVLVSLNTGLSVTRNNIFGNLGNSSGANCGLINNDASVTLSAPGNFFGGTGPGLDPADDICGPGLILVTPLAKKEFRVKLISP